MAKEKLKVTDVFKESDLNTILAHYLSGLQSNQGTQFKVYFIDESTLHVKIGPQAFAIVVSEQAKFN